MASRLNFYAPQPNVPLLGDYFAPVAQALQQRREYERQLARDAELKKYQGAQIEQMQSAAARADAELELRRQQEARIAENNRMDRERQTRSDQFTAMGEAQKALNAGDNQRAQAVSSMFGLGGSYAGPGAGDTQMEPMSLATDIEQLAPQSAMQVQLGDKRFTLSSDYEQRRVEAEKVREMGKADPIVSGLSENLAKAVATGSMSVKDAAKAIQDARENALDRRSRERQASMRAAAAAKRAKDKSGELTPSEVNLGFKALAEARTATGYNANQKDLIEFERLKGMVENGTALSDAASIGAFVKFAQGGAGVLTDNDMKAFWDRAGGIFERVGDEVVKVVTGKIPEGRRQQLTQILAKIVAQGEARVQRYRDTANVTLQATGLPPESQAQFYRSAVVGSGGDEKKVNAKGAGARIDEMLGKFGGGK